LPQICPNAKKKSASFRSISGKPRKHAKSNEDYLSSKRFRKNRTVTEKGRAS